MRRAGCLLFAFALAGCDFRIAAIAVGDGGTIDGPIVPGDGGGAPGGGAPDGGAPDGAAPGDLGGGGPFLAVTPATPPPAVDLSLEGTLDWAHWGFATAGDFDHKATGNGQISNFASVGINAPTAYGDNRVAYRWNDGLPGSGRHPKTDGNGSSTGVYVLTGGFKIVAPAGPGPHRLRVYVGAYNAQGQLDVTLSDGSAPAYHDASFVSSGGNPVNAQYVITYAAATPGQQLVVQWTIANPGVAGNITLQAASLQDGS